MDQNKIGKYIKELRLKNNLSQSDLAKKLSVTNQAISKWENGRGIPDVEMLKQLSI
jgi:transcriptional regulator with XRE-family HTH domain